MQKNTDKIKKEDIRTYNINTSAVFRKTKERFGGLSNMAAGFPLCVNGIDIRTSEALYQACRFPHSPEIQEKIINEKSPMTAKMISKPYRAKTRGDWNDIRIGVMRWCLRVKLAQNWNEFTRVIFSTNELPIVEFSRKDSFWGAKVEKDKETLVGMNILGRLLMELRKQLKLKPKTELLQVNPIPINDFLLFGKQIQSISVVEKKAFSDVAQKPSELTKAIPVPTSRWLSLYPQPWA